MGRKVDTADMPKGQSETPISPQRECSTPRPSNDDPDGHNPETKIQKLTGLGDRPEAKKQQMRILKEQQKHLNGEEVSPVSISSSDRGFEGPRTAVSDLDGDTEADGQGVLV
ncbi:hypothetical protein N657DRAFT_630216 [Parathielavia appendiculata]|uniref:Uncharacterized protein n=1 Tax=Parathielavia appendiculata TaxID=2587402 RepID=A0AAN6UB66_9PEZI|nr:hypothetical protein N657DRAFT_630216 [Parathielavia appendiculata]